jgi:hypothetical protein
MPGMDFDMRLGLKFFGTMFTLEPVAGHLVSLVHVGLQLGSRKLLHTNSSNSIISSNSTQTSVVDPRCYIPDPGSDSDHLLIPDPT